MNLQKTKTYPIALSEIKEDLRISETDSSYDGQLSRLIKSAVHICESYLGFDVVPTSTILTEYDYSSGYKYFINQPLAVVTSIVIDGQPYTGYSIQFNQMNTIIVFKKSVDCKTMVVNYNTGSIPAHDIQRAISIKVAELFDVDVNGYTANVSASNSFERILGGHKNFIY